MSEATYLDIFKIVLLCIGWFVVSSANGVISKVILSEFPYPFTVSMTQLASVTVFSIPVVKFWHIPAVENVPMKYWCTMIVPLAAGKFLASVSSYVSVWKVPLSYAHTVKATLPLFTVALSRIILKEQQTLQVYASLIPIIGGVLIASATELSFNFIGLISALLATLGFSLQSIFSKKCLKDTDMHHLRLLFILSSICTVCVSPLWLVTDFRNIVESSVLNGTHGPRLIALLMLDGVCSFFQNMIAFTIISYLSPLSYAVANATKRISIITVSLLTLRNPVTAYNIFGMMVAIFGVFLYNKAKYDMHRERKRQTVLPVETEMIKNDYGIQIIPPANDVVIPIKNFHDNPEDQLWTKRESDLLNRTQGFFTNPFPRGLPSTMSALTLDSMT